MLILGIIWLHRHMNITASVWIQKVVKFIICTVIAIAGLILLLINFLYVFLGLDDKETVMRKENGYTYLEVSWSNMGYNAYTEEYVTNNPFIMKKIYVPTKDDTFTNEQPDASNPDNTENNDQTDNDADSADSDTGNSDSQDNTEPYESDEMG